MMMPEDELVDVRDVHEACAVWTSYHHYDHMQEAYRGFRDYLGAEYLPKGIGFSGYWKLTNEQAHRMRLLLGPHARTVIKAYYVRKQDDPKCNTEEDQHIPS